MNGHTEKIEAVFHRAMDFSSPEERERYLNDACAGDPTLRDEIDDLLKSAAAADAVFEAGREAFHASSLPPATILSEKVDDRIGHYKLLEKIGEGGMGVVYMAEQERPIRRKVALKIIKLGMDTRQVVARFEAERQALAMMDHPNIARVLDGGATDAGRPFFVMELVEGVPITQFCDANQLSIQARLKLFIPVCHAIQSAHQKGVIHRDLKPSNVLVTMHNGAPHPMVIDFGVAKAIDQKLTEKTLFTNFGAMIGTPAYMSPEQAQMSKLDVDTRSDIYSLGVLLYELLTGTTPFPEERLRSVAYGEMQRIITEEEPERPSTRLTKKIVSKSEIQNPNSELDSDLDWIVMKCLEKDRNRRYEAANGLASDLSQFLSNEPVAARPPSATYRFRKLVRRHKLAFSAAAAIAFALVAGVSIASWQAVRATRAERSARAVKDFLLEQALSANPYVEGQPDPNRRASLERMARAVDLKFTNEPIIEAELRMILANGFFALADYTNGLLQCQKALEVRQRTLGPYHSDTLWSLSWVVQGQIGRVRKVEGRDLLESALKEIKKSRHLLSSGEAEIVWTYGCLLCNQDDQPAKGLPYLQEGLAAFRPTADPRDPTLQNKLTILARATENAGRPEEAEKLWQENARQAESAFDPDHLLVAQLKKGQAGFLRRRGRAREGLPLIEFAVPIYRRVLGTNQWVTVDAEMLLAETLDLVGHTVEAGQLYATLHQRWVSFYPNLPLARDKCLEIAQFFVREQQYEEAKAAFETLRVSFEANPPKNVAEFETFIQAAGATKGWPGAAEVCRQQLESFADSAAACRTMGTVFLYVGDEDGYRKIAARAIALASAATNWQDQLAILHIAGRGPFTFSTEQRTQCEKLIQSVERGLPSAPANERPSTDWAIGAMQLRLGDLTNALAHLERALSAMAEPASRGRTLLIKALCLHRMGNTDDARDSFSQAAAFLKSVLGDRGNVAEGLFSDADRQDILLLREAESVPGLK